MDKTFAFVRNGVEASFTILELMNKDGVFLCSPHFHIYNGREIEKKKTGGRALSTIFVTAEQKQCLRLQHLLL